MPGRFTFFSRAAFLVALSMSTATSAHAQLGKLKKIGADAAKDAAMGKKPEDPTAARITYDITAERLSAIVTALTPSLAAAQRAADAKAVATGYDAKFKAASDCLQKSASGTPDMVALQSSKYVAMAEHASALGAKVSAAFNAKRYREYLALQDTATVLQVQSAAMMFKNSCPPLPYRPAALIDAQAADMERAASGATRSASSSELVVAPDARAGMTTGQWGRVRERIALWLLIQSGDVPATGEKFTDAEQAVLSARATEIKKFGPVFKSGSMPWVSWGDVKSW